MLPKIENAKERGSECVIAMQPVACPLCGSEANRPRYQGQDRLLGHAGVFPIVVCLNCGLTYASPRPINLTPFYQGDYGPHQAVHPEQQTNGSVSVQDGLPKLYYDVVQQATPLRQGTLLDIGCGSGDFLVAMHQLGWQVRGYEPDPQAAQRANLKLPASDPQIVVTQVDLEQAFSDNSFDLITLWHVIEHVPNPVQTLATVRRMLKPGGICIVQTPRLDSLEGRLFGPYFCGLDAPRHLCIFTHNTLALAFEKAGWSAPQTYAAPSYLFFRLSVLFWLRAVRPSWAESIYRALSRPFMDKALWHLFRPIDQLSLGSQLTLAAKK